MILRRSIANLNSSPTKVPKPTHQHRERIVKPEIPQSLRNNTKDYQTEVVSEKFMSMFQQPGRPLQIETTVSLTNGIHTFLRAGTGYGKSRIPEVYAALHQGTVKTIVLTICPLDYLGNNQVADKTHRGLSAINCTSANATKKNFEDIKRGVYQFVYMSPEVFLNNPLFRAVFFSSDFQRRLILIVIDEAHSVYSWGIVESREARHSSAHLQTQDRGVFRPSYGNLAQRLLSAGVPVLLLTATCRPVAVEAIKANLKWTDDDVELLDGELVREEIRLIRVPLDHPSNPGNDIHRFFAPQSIIPDSMIPRTLIYSNSQNETLALHQAVCTARDMLHERFNGNSSCVRRFHAVTGPKDKDAHTEAYSNGDVAVMTCTMALGMGCDWPHTRRVITVGRSDPSVLGQMVGRCGRDGRPGVGIMLVETKRLSGKNDVSDFVNPYKMSDDDRMDALAITPVCLRIAFQVDNVIGHVPLSFDDPAYKAEKERQKKKGMQECLCSNCHPELVASFLENQPHATIDNFTSLVTTTSSGPSPITNGWKMPPLQFGKSTLGTINACASNEVIRKNPLLCYLGSELEKSFLSLYQHTYPSNNCYVRPHHMFPEAHLWKIIKNFELLRNGTTLRLIFGSEPIKGTFQLIHEHLESWSKREDFCMYLHDSQARAEEISAQKKNKPPNLLTQTPIKSRLVKKIAAQGTSKNKRKVKPNKPVTKSAIKGAAQGGSNSKNHQADILLAYNCLNTQISPPSVPQIFVTPRSDRTEYPIPNQNPNTYPRSHLAPLSTNMHKSTYNSTQTPTYTTDSNQSTTYTYDSSQMREHQNYLQSNSMILDSEPEANENVNSYKNWNYHRTSRLQEHQNYVHPNSMRIPNMMITNHRPNEFVEHQIDPEPKANENINSRSAPLCFPQVVRSLDTVSGFQFRSLQNQVLEHQNYSHSQNIEINNDHRNRQNKDSQQSLHHLREGMSLGNPSGTESQSFELPPSEVILASSQNHLQQYPSPFEDEHGGFL